MNLFALLQNQMYPTGFDSKIPVVLPFHESAKKRNLI